MSACFDPDRHHRRSIRLRGYDYAQAGAYFVTICTRNHECLLGDVIGGTMNLNEWGRTVSKEWLRTAEIRPTVELDAFVIMPNHIHGIIVIRDGDVGRGTRYGRGTLQRAPTTTDDHPVERFGKPTSNSIPTIVRLFKSTTTKQINQIRNTPGTPLWQRNYYEHVICDEESAARIRQYIADNPARWAEDTENPSRVAMVDPAHRHGETGGDTAQRDGGVVQHGGDTAQRGRGTLQRAPTGHDDDEGNT